jgi:hypothetical protein
MIPSAGDRASLQVSVSGVVQHAPGLGRAKCGRQLELPAELLRGLTRSCWELGLAPIPR